MTPPVVFQYFIYAFLGLLGYLLVSETADIPPVLMVLGIVVVYGMTSVFGRLTISITESVFSVGFGFLKHRIEIGNIDYVEARQMPWWKYGGFGVRFGLDWSVGYVMNYGRGVRVVPKRGRVLFISTKRPDAVVEKLVELMGAKVGSV